MTEDTSDETDSTKKLRGTASLPNPISGEEPPEGPSESIPTVTIHAPDGSLRTYKLTDDVKEGYESMIEEKFDSMEVFWYEMWWVGSELVIEYEGCVRDDELRPEVEDMDPEKIQMMMMQGQRPKMNGVPKRQNPAEQGDGMNPKKMMNGDTPEPSVTIDLNDSSDDTDVNVLDEGVLPVWGTTRIDVQNRANENPLQVEDLFIKPWSDEDGQMPLNSENKDGEVDDDVFEVDFRDHTDDKNETVRDGARGDRWNL